MANLATLKAALNAAIYQNNQNAITGEALNIILNSIIDTLGTGYRYAGVATPSANPGTIDNRVFYLATAAGTYTNFGAVQLDGKSLHIFIYDTTWHDVALDVPTTAALAVVAGTGADSVKGKSAGCIASGDGSTAIGSTETDGVIQATAKGAHAEGYAADEEEIAASGDGAHAEGNCALLGAINAEGAGSHAEGTATYAGGECSHAEGGGTAAEGDYSHAEGRGTLAKNEGEHAEGRYNASHKKTEGTAAEQAAGSTLSSIGFGTTSNNRKNAIEVMQNGDVYIKGVGGYDGTNPAQSGARNIQGLWSMLFSQINANHGELVDIENEDCVVLINGSTAYGRVYDYSLFSQIANYVSGDIETVTEDAFDMEKVIFVGVVNIVYDDTGAIQGLSACVLYDYSGDIYYFEAEI